MQVDVVIVTFNSASHLPRVLDALPEAANVIVVDNASADASADIAEAHGATVVRSTTNAGFAAGCNRGAALGHAKKILFLNPDAVIEPDSLELLVKEMDTDIQVGVAAPRLLRPDGSRQRVQWPYPSAWGAWREALGCAPKEGESSRGFVVGACLLVRRAAFEAVGGFDERFWLYGEEADLCRRIEDLGWSIQRFPSATANHIGGASGGNDPADGRLVYEHFMRGGEHFVAKHDGRGALASYRAANLVGSVGRAALGVGARSSEHRRRARRLTHALTSSPTAVHLDSPATAAPGRGLVVCSLEAWDEVWRRNQFFVRELLAADPDLRVLFVEPAYDIAHEKRRGSGRRHHAGLRPVDGESRVVRFEPVKWLPRKLGPWADRWRDAQVLDAVRQLGFVEPRLWVNDPSYATLADTVDWPVLYDITDDWTHASDPTTRETAEANETSLFARAEKVVVCSPNLLESRKALRDDVELIANGVDAAALQRPRPRPEDLPGGATAVYVGTLHTDRLDVELTAELAERLDDVSVVLVGPDALDRQARRRLDDAGVLRLGARPYADVPGYLQHASVLIVPHVISDFTEALDPIKAYESLAVGTATVATAVAGFRDLGGPIHVASRGEFAETVSALVDEHPDADPQPVPSWQSRARDFAAVLADAAATPVGSQASQAKLNVVYFDHCAQLSGGELALSRLLPALRDDVEPLVILGESGPLEEVLAKRDLPYEIFELDPSLTKTNRYEVSAVQTGPRTMLNTAKAVWGLHRRLRALKPDLVHANSLKAGLIGSVAGRLAGVPVVWHIRDRMADDYLPPSAIRLVRTAARVLPSAVITNSESTKTTIGIPAATVTYSPVELSNVEPAKPGVGEPLHVVMVGRLAPWKGQDVFLRAFAAAFDGDEARATLVGASHFGEHDFGSTLHDLAKELGIDDRVTFTGHLDDVNTVLAGADVLVHASTVAEPFGQVVVEGMAAGLAVIAADAGGPAEVITDGVDGLLTPPNAPDALAIALRTVGADRELRHALGAAAQQRARDFTPDRIAAQTAQVYRRTVTR